MRFIISPVTMSSDITVKPDSPLLHYYDAFIARYELIRAAKRSIDMQYFIFASDEVSTLFMEEIVKAVDRGGKVRIQSGLESVL